MQGTAQHNVKIHCADSLTDGQGLVLKHLVGFSPDTCRRNQTVQLLSFGWEEAPGKDGSGKVSCFLMNGCCIAKDGHRHGRWDAESLYECHHGRQVSELLKGLLSLVRNGSSLQ